MHDERDPEERRRPPERRLDRGERAGAVKAVVALSLVVVFVLFIVRNSEPVPVDFVFFKSEIRLIWVFLACAVLGAAIAWLVGRPRRRAMRRLVEELERGRREEG